MDINRVIDILESILGKSKKSTKNNWIFFCPFCNHYKPKLTIDPYTGHFNCWVCLTNGRKIIKLLKLLNVDSLKIKDYFNAAGVSTGDINNLFQGSTTSYSASLQLPKEFISLLKSENTPDYRNALRYLRNERGFSDYDIIKYQIGYCDSGNYKGKVIIPSYDCNGQLNYFTGRSFYESSFKHLNPDVSKDILPMDLYINWSLPIILVEGAIDAITIKRNSIPLFGKTIPEKLLKKIIEMKVKKIYICLDNDALKQSIKICEIFMNDGIEVYFVELNGKDPNEIGFNKMTKILKAVQPLTFSDLIKYKLSL